MVLSTLILLAYFLPSLFVAVSSGNTPVQVTVRIEGPTSTIFEDNVTTQGHEVYTVSGGKHHCDGTNNYEHPIPVPVATAALDDASVAGGFTWDGTFDTQFDDYFVTVIDGVPVSVNTSQSSWFIYLNNVLAPLGGCQLEIRAGDEVLWAFYAFDEPITPEVALFLEGPQNVVSNEPAKFRVTDQLNGNPISGASLGGMTTGDNGYVTLTFASPGVNNLKAEKSGAVRSNNLQVTAT